MGEGNIVRNTFKLAVVIVWAFWWLSSAAQAGDPQTEADRCLRWLDAFFHGQIDQAALIAAEQLRPGDVPNVYVESQRNNLKKLHELIYKLGGGAPIGQDTLNDAVVTETGDIIKLQRWQFGKSLRAYVGCVSYPGTDDPWHLVVKFEDDPAALVTKLKDAAKSRQTSPPERSQ